MVMVKMSKVYPQEKLDTDNEVGVVCGECFGTGTPKRKESNAS